MNIKKNCINPLVIYFVLVLVFLFAMPVFADYKSDIARGNAAYKSGDLQTALKYYMDADVENPNAQLESFISAIEKKIDSGQGPKMVEKPQGVYKETSPLPEQKPGNLTGFGSLLIGLDVATAAVAIYALIDYNNANNYYEALYTAENNTSTDNYIMLQAQENYVNQKGSTAVALGVTTGVLIAYTLSDMLFIHSAFPLQAAYNPKDNKICLTYSINY
jgi:hypothetical protein